jgi:hypothetical protein
MAHSTIAARHQPRGFDSGSPSHATNDMKVGVLPIKLRSNSIVVLLHQSHCSHHIGMITLGDMPITRPKRAKRIFCATAIIIMGVLWFRGSGNHSNSLAQWGFPVSNFNVVLDEAPWNLKGEERLVKVNLTSAQAKALRKAFTAQAAPQTLSLSFSPKQLQLKSANPQWRPDLVKQSWQGSFEKNDGVNSIFYCQYIFDIKNPNKIVLYFYGITFDN